MNKQKNYRRRQRGITPITTPRNSPGVAQFSMSEVAQFSVSLDSDQALGPEAAGGMAGVSAAVDPAKAAAGLSGTTAAGSARQHGHTPDVTNLCS